MRGATGRRLVVVNLQAEDMRPACHGLADAAHAMMPSRFLPMRWPSIQVGVPARPALPSVRIEAPSDQPPRTARISAMVMSAVSSVRTFGVLVTVMPRAWAATDVDIVDAIAEIGDQLQLAVGSLRSSSVISSVTVGTRISADRTASAICSTVHRAYRRD